VRVLPTLLLVAVTGLLLVGINVVVVKAVIESRRWDAGTRPRTELRVMFDPEGIMVGSPTIKQYEAFSSSNVLTQGFIGNSRFFAALGQTSTDRNGDRDWIVGKDHTRGVQSLMWMPNTEITYSGLVILANNARKYINQHPFGWRLPTVNYLDSDWDGCPVQWKGSWEWDGDPCTLIDTHGFTHDTALPEVSNEGKDRVVGQFSFSTGETVR